MSGQSLRSSDFCHSMAVQINAWDPINILLMNILLESELPWIFYWNQNRLERKIILEVTTDRYFELLMSNQESIVLTLKYKNSDKIHQVISSIMVYVCVCVTQSVTQSCPTLWDPMDHSLPGSVHGKEWVAISFSRGSSQPGIEPLCLVLQADSSPSEPPGKPPSMTVVMPFIFWIINNTWNINSICVQTVFNHVRKIKAACDSILISWEAAHLHKEMRYTQCIQYVTVILK